MEAILREILDELKSINSKIDSVIQGNKQKDPKEIMDKIISLYPPAIRDILQNGGK